MQMNDLIINTKLAIAEYQEATEQLKNVILGQGFIIHCEGVYLTFDIAADGRVSNPRPSQPHRVVRLSRRDAERVAASMRNGNGTTAEAVHVRVALYNELQNQRTLLAALAAHQSTVALPELQNVCVEPRA